MRLDPFSPSYSRDPAATWRRLYATGQLVGFDDDLGLWLIAGHDNVRTALSETTRFTNRATLTPIRPVSPAAREILAGLDAPAVTITTDPPEHLRTRAILRALFPTSAMRAQHQWGSVVQARVTDLVTDLASRPAADLMHFAVRLPLTVVLDILGLPDTDADDLRGWTDDFAHLLWGDPDPETQIACAHSSVAHWRYCERAVHQRIASGEPGGGLIGDLLRFRNNDDTNLTVGEVAALALNIVGAGWETTASALGHALYHALAEPGRWARLADDEHYLALHVEESLRHSPAIDGWLRQTTGDITLDGVTIPAGSRCLVLIGTANHDPAVYDQPHLFQPYRPRAGQHLAFGAGPHYCIGAALARLELTTALGTLARRLPDLTLDEDYQARYRRSAALRQHTDLPVRQAGRCPVSHPTAGRPQ